MISHYYLIEGPQTNLTNLVYDHAEQSKHTIIKNPKITDLPEPLISIHKTCKYISELDKIKDFNPNPRSEHEVKTNQRLKDSVFRQRDLDQVLKEGYFPTCSDIGLIFRGLMIAQDIPTAYIETFHEDYLFDKVFHGHVFGKVFDDDNSVFVNPTSNPIISDDDSQIFPYIIFREGLDSWDVGINGYKDMHRLKKENMQELISTYETNLIKNMATKFEEIQKLKATHKE